MSRGQWTSYESFNLIELIKELKTRIEEPFRADDTLHGMMIGGKDYYQLIQDLKDFLHNDDEKWRSENKRKVNKLLKHISYIELESINNSYLKLGKKYIIIGHDGCGRNVGDYLVINDNYEVEWIRQDFFKEEIGCTKNLMLHEERYFDFNKYLED
jgi:hypothetical protein